MPHVCATQTDAQIIRVDGNVIACVADLRDASRHRHRVAHYPWIIIRAEPFLTGKLSTFTISP